VGVGVGVDDDAGDRGLGPGQLARDAAPEVLGRDDPQGALGHGTTPLPQPASGSAPSALAGGSQLIDARLKHPGGLLGCLASMAVNLMMRVLTEREQERVWELRAEGHFVGGDWTRARPPPQYVSLCVR